MKFEFKKVKKITEKASEYEIITDSGIINVWLPNKSVTVENNTIEVLNWLMTQNNRLKEFFPDFVPTEPVRETSLDVLRDIREILKELMTK